MKANILMLNREDTPVKLTQINNAPDRLFYSGNIEILAKKPALAVVGARKITPYSARVIQMIVNRLAEQGIVIISGLASGVDTAAHKAALSVNGATIAVLPTPIDKIYPTQNIRLSQDISKSGLLISEYASGTKPQKAYFAQRNRIVSGLSDAVLIIQASERSGTLITARLAKEQGRKLLVIPAELTNKSFEGNNRLLREGATLVRSAQDVLEELGIESFIATNAIKDPLLQLIDSGAELSEMQQKLKLTTQELNQKLSMLEIEGKIKPRGVGSWVLSV